MALPDPLPDNPMRWEGWKLYASANAYERLCLDFSANPSDAQIEAHCRQLVTWWQKKLPLKNQPSNPLAQLLRSGLDEAPAKLAEARTLLLDPRTRAQIDAALLAAEREAALAEFDKFLGFVLADGGLDAMEEESLYGVGENLGLHRDEMKARVDAELQERSIARTLSRELPPAPAPAAASANPAAPAPAQEGGVRAEFLRMLRLSELDEITDDQRDAFCNMGEALGLSGGDAEDIIDEYLEERMIAGTQAVRSAFPAAPSSAPVVPKAPAVDLFAPVSPLQRAEEKKANPNFTNPLGIELLLVSSGTFEMGSCDPEAAPNEQPVTPTHLSAFYLSRFPVTNAQYEQFDPAHRARRAPGAGDHHPVVYVTRTEAGQFCDWLAKRERRPYRLPTEAEWEYAARGSEGRKFPWGARLESADRANFADANKRLPWSDLAIDCGFEAASPVGSFLQGAGPFGHEDMAGNVWEWCLDCFAAYPGRKRSNPKGPVGGPRQIYRGGSWKSRITSLRASSRGINSPAYSANDVGFRVACECGK